MNELTGSNVYNIREHKGVAGGRYMSGALFDSYIEQYGGELSRLALSLCHNFHDADDLYQDTWVKAMRFYNRYNPDKPFDKWLFTICVNTFKDRMRAHGNSRQAYFKSSEEKERFLESISGETEPDDDKLDLMTAIGTLPHMH